MHLNLYINDFATQKLYVGFGYKISHKNHM